MTSVYYHLLLLLFAFSGGECQSSLTPSLSISINNERSSLQDDSGIDTLATNSHFHPSLVQGLTSPLTTTSYNVIQDSLSSVDYLPVVKPTMSSAYSGISNDTKSTENALVNSFKRSDLPQSITSANQLSKHLDDFEVLESSVGISDNFWTDYFYYSQNTMENYVELSSFVAPSNIHSALLENSRTPSTDVVRSTKTILTPNLESITHSNDLSVSSSSLSVDFDAFRANTFGIEFTAHQPSYTERKAEPSEWQADIFPSVAYDQALFTAFSNSLELDYDIYYSETFNWDQNSEITSSYIPEISNSVFTESGTLLSLQSSFDSIQSSFDGVQSSKYSLQSSVHDVQSSFDDGVPSSVHGVQSSVDMKSEIFPTSVLSENMDTTSNTYSSDILSDSSYSNTFFTVYPSSQILVTSYVNEVSSQILDSQVHPQSSHSSDHIPTSSIQVLKSAEVKSTSWEVTPTYSTLNNSSGVSLASSILMSDAIPTSVYTPPTTTTPTTTSTVRSIPTTAPPLNPSETKEIFKDCRFLFTFSGDCHLVMNNTIYLAEFIEGLRKTLVEKLHISNNRIKPHDISCGSIKIYVTFKNVSYPRFGDRLKNIVERQNLIVPTYMESEVLTFTALTVVEVALPTGDVNSLDLPPSGINNIDIIVIIVACCVCGILVILGITVCVKECYKRKYAQSFDLLDMPHVNLKLEDFTLTRIPRPKTTYNNDNVTANPYADRFNQQPDKENGHSSNGHHVSNGNHIDLKDVHVRMQPLKNEGIIVGVTGYSSSNGAPRKKKRAPSASSRLSSEDRLAGDPSTENLVPENNITSIGASNPVFIDDEQGSTSTLDITQNNQMNI